MLSADIEEILRVNMSSLELGAGVDVASEGAVVDIGSVVVKEGHDGLVLGTIPLDVARLAVSVPVDVLVVLMVDRRLPGAPLAVRIGNRRVLGEDTGDGPVEQVGVVNQGLSVEGMVIKDDGPVVTETAANTSNDEPADPAVREPATNVEVLDGKLTDDSKTKNNTKLSTGCIVGPVEVGLVGGTSDHGKVLLGEPALEHIHVVKGLLGPLELTLLENVLRDTETDELTILNVVRDLGVHSSAHFVIIGVLTSY